MQRYAVRFGNSHSLSGGKTCQICVYRVVACSRSNKETGDQIEIYLFLLEHGTFQIWRQRLERVLIIFIIILRRKKVFLSHAAQHWDAVWNWQSICCSQMVGLNLLYPLKNVHFTKDISNEISNLTNSLSLFVSKTKSFSLETQCFHLWIEDVCMTRKSFSCTVKRAYIHKRCTNVCIVNCSLHTLLSVLTNLSWLITNALS